MKLSQFRFKLPDHLLAQYPAPYRDEARLMVVHRKTGEIEQMLVKDIVNLFEEEDLSLIHI